MTELPQPPHWRDTRGIFLLGVGLFGTAAIAITVLGVKKLQHGQVLTAVILFGGAVVSVFFTLIAARVQFATSPLRATYDSRGTTLRPDPVLAGLGFGWLVSITVSGLLYLDYVPSGVVDLPLSRARQFSGLLLVGLAVVLAGAGLIGFARRRTLGYLRLTPTGVELAGLIRTQQSGWNDVVDISDQSPNKQIRQPTVFVTKEGKRLIVQNTSGFAPSGAALHWMFRHYWRHPEDRAELTDGRAIERLRSEEFVPE